jgi:hypothetical protein
MISILLYAIVTAKIMDTSLVAYSSAYNRLRCSRRQKLEVIDVLLNGDLQSVSYISGHGANKISELSERVFPMG